MVRVQEIKHLVKTHGVRVFPILPLASSRMGAHNRRWTDRDTGGRTHISVRFQNAIKNGTHTLKSLCPGSQHEDWHTPDCRSYF